MASRTNRGAVTSARSSDRPRLAGVSVTRCWCRDCRVEASVGDDARVDSCRATMVNASETAPRFAGLTRTMMLSHEIPRCLAHAWRSSPLVAVILPA